MARSNFRRRHTDLQFESVARISSFPIVESGISIAGNVYDRIKRSNSLMGWSLDTAEHSLAVATATAKPAMMALNGPISTIDHILCKGIDMVEQRVPAVHLPPHQMYRNTREYVNNKFVKPVLIRADSVKMIGSHAAKAAVERLDDAINVADQYVDRYLPPDPADKVAEASCTTDSSKQVDETDCGSGGTNANASNNKVVRNTIEHGARLSRKLQRRLTRRTLAEARALKEQGTECIHVLLYVVELIATDPKLAMQKAKELWAWLSEPEPENQAPPASLEQLLVMCTRETARRMVHLVNGTASLASRAPRRLGRAVTRIVHQMLAISEQALKVTHDTILGGAIGFVRELVRAAREERRRARHHSLLHAHGSNGEKPTSAGGNGYLSLITKINIVPLPRVPARLSSVIRELQNEIDDDSDVAESREGRLSSSKPRVEFVAAAKRGREIVKSRISRGPIVANGETIVAPLRDHLKRERKDYLFGSVKPILASRQRPE